MKFSIYKELTIINKTKSHSLRLNQLNIIE